MGRPGSETTSGYLGEAEDPAALTVSDVCWNVTTYVWLCCALFGAPVVRAADDPSVVRCQSRAKDHLRQKPFLLQI
ncbi:jg27889 [Pararge aegeria aegeria]|uniref:Jg27889 protein n=1 Tax=Pararge aegeria aegeria TaxID=348720 RepID=A0A8S4RZT6_9NEOP|nr:jg27889 [Pararge aegeria aegeria]